MAHETANAMVDEGVQIARAIDAILDEWRDGRAADTNRRLAEDERVALRFVRWVDGDEERFHAVLDALPDAVDDWMLNLAPELARHGRHAAAETIARGFAAVWEPENFLADLALGLAWGGAHDAARRVIAECLSRFPNDPWVSIKCGDARAELGEMDAAARLYRRGRELAGDDLGTVEAAEERLESLAS